MIESVSRLGNVEVISRWIIGFLCILTLLEAFLFPETENIYGCFTFIFAWIILSVFVMKQKNVNICFLPFIALFGLGVCFFFLPLPVTMIEGKPLTFRFQCPYLTFNYQLLNLIMLVLAYRLCLRLSRKGNVLTYIWDKIGYFTAPTDSQIWIMGFIGLISQTLLLSIMGTDEARAENLGWFGHLIGVTKVFACFPVLLLFKNLYVEQLSSKVNKRYIILYLILLSALGLATGKRTAIFGSFVTLLMCYIVPIFSENKAVFTKKIAILSMVFLYLITGPVADIAAAMWLGRDNSDRTGASKTFDNILELYQDKEKLHTMYQVALMMSDNGGDNLSGWSEYYVDNILLDRFCNLRVCDMTIDYARKLGFDNPTMKSYMSNQVLFVLPTPVLKALDINTNKYELQYTPGDLLSMESLNIGHYHGYRVAGDVGIGLYLWGEYYYFYAFFIYFILFYYLASLSKTNRMGLLIFPLPVLADLFRYFLFFNNGTGLAGVITMILRTGWQAIVVYCIIFFVIRKIVR